MMDDNICTHDEKSCSREKCTGQNEIEFCYDYKAVEVASRHIQIFLKMSNRGSYSGEVQMEICSAEHV